MARSTRSTTMLRPAQRGHTAYARNQAEHTTTHWMRWRGVSLKLSEINNPRWSGWTILHLEVVAARDTPVPITNTGFLQHGIDAEELSAAGGAVAFMTAWLDREAETPRFRRAVARWKQGDLFDFALVEEEPER